MSENDLIRRGDATAACLEERGTLGRFFNAAEESYFDGAQACADAIAALPAASIPLQAALKVPEIAALVEAAKHARGDIAKGFVALGYPTTLSDSIKLLDDAIRNLAASDPTGTEALAAHDARVRAKALREAAQVCRTLGVLGGQTANPYACWKTHAENLSAAILALIEKDGAK